MKKTLLITLFTARKEITSQKWLRSILLFVLFFQVSAYANAAFFNLVITKTDETCLGNGTITFAITNPAPGGTVEYRVYQLPDTVTPIAVLTTNFLGGLTTGTYRVVATETVGSVSTQQTQDVAITNAIVPMTYTAASTNAFCGPDGTITITTTAGTSTSYEIISGPVVVAPQASPTFTGLPAGVYGIRVFDTCGQGNVTTHTLLSDSVQLNVASGDFPDTQLPSCTTITASNVISPVDSNDSIIYPLDLHYTIFPPDGSPPIIVDSILAGGDAALEAAETIIPFWYDTPYTYNLVVTDQCGTQYVSNNNIVDVAIFLTLSATQAECGTYFLTASASKYVAPFQLNFLSVPAGFDPVAFNAGHPGPFSASDIYYGDYTTPVPYGYYKAEIIDACGHTIIAETELIEQPAEPIVTKQPYPGCASNMSLVKIFIPGYTIVSAVITSAPAAYVPPLPDDVTDMITTADEGVVLPYMIEGTYIIHLIDECGNVYDKEFTVQGLNTNASISTRADCDDGFGTVRIRGISTTLVSGSIIAAPAAFTETLPHDVTPEINSSGTLSLAGLPAGMYTFEVTDNCGITHTKTIDVIGYSVISSNFTLTPHCGAFDIALAHSSVGAIAESFWLQKYFPGTNTWGHPLTGAAYPDDTMPNATNSILIDNNANNINQNFTGEFRIVKRYEAYGNGSVSDFANCIKVLHEFEFTGLIEITGIERLTCNGASSDVKILVVGVDPVIYKIIKKNGVPFVIDNGTSNIFTNLEPALYTFFAQHSCGDSRTREYDVALLPSLAVANQPADMTACDDSSNDGQETFVLTDQDAAILGTQNPANYVLTYHSSLPDANAGVNPLPANYTSGNATIYARLKFITSLDCFDITSFDLIVNPYPALNMQTTWALCQGVNTTITADSGFASYLWSTGATTQSIVVSQSGQYTLEVTKNYNPGICNAILTIDVVASVPPTIKEIEISDWTSDSNSISVLLDGIDDGTYMYSIDGIHFQTSNVFNGLLPGPYTIIVKNACGLADEEVFLLMYPKFFTPNEDGFNDFWRVKFSEVEPHMITYIFDRYGKLITGFGTDSPGWDGKLNGELLPSTDYWFLVVRENGRKLRGHFAMKR